VRDRPSRDFGDERRGAVVKAVTEAWDEGCPVAGQDQDAFEEMADIAIRRRDSLSSVTASGSATRDGLKTWPKGSAIVSNATPSSPAL
jgi:hypothetical protein